MWLEGRIDQFQGAQSLANIMSYLPGTVDVTNASVQQIANVLIKNNKMPIGTDPYRLAAQIKSVVSGGFDPQQDIK